MALKAFKLGMTTWGFSPYSHEGAPFFREKSHDEGSLKEFQVDLWRGHGKEELPPMQPEGQQHLPEVWTDSESGCRTWASRGRWSREKLASPVWMLSNWQRHSVCKCCPGAHDGQGDKNRCSFIAGTFRVWMEEGCRANWERGSRKGDLYFLLSFVFLWCLSTHGHLLYYLLSLAQNGGTIEKHSDATSLRRLEANSSSLPLSLCPLTLHPEAQHWNQAPEGTLKVISVNLQSKVGVSWIKRWKGTFSPDNWRSFALRNQERFSETTRHGGCLFLDSSVKVLSSDKP